MGWNRFLTAGCLLCVVCTIFAQPASVVSVDYDRHLTARGNVCEVLCRVVVACVSDSASLTDMMLKVDADVPLADIEQLRIYSTGRSAHFDARNLVGATLLGQCVPVTGVFSCPLQALLPHDTAYLWLTMQVAANASEGDRLHVEVRGLRIGGEEVMTSVPSDTLYREVVLARTTLYRPGDYSSAQYRIPGIITAADGALVAVTDKRKYNDGDLPQDIDIVCNRSVDGGRTWSAPVTMAQGTGVNHGFGDCALVRGAGEHELIAAFVGGVGLWNSTPTNPQRSYIARSQDGGMTWSAPVDVTDYIFGSNCVVPAHRSWRSSFFGSGNGLRTSTGRIIFVAAIRVNSQYSLNNYAFYSDDNGETWQLSGRASVGGDEAKVVELADGRILMSIRHADHRWYNISSDGGATWQSAVSTWQDLLAPACNGDIIRYTAVSQGADTNRLLHSLPYGTERRDVTVYVSYDEGVSWPVSRCVVPYGSAYSSLCVLPDGTIGLYVEEDDPDLAGYQTVFYNFSLDWLSSGTDHYIATSVPACNGNISPLKIYPVPSSSYIVIETAGLLQLTITDLSGRLVRAITTNGEAQVKVNVADLAPGAYAVSASDENGRVRTGKFIVE